MDLAICPNREKVLLNLKWFVHRVIKSFEMKLVCAVGRTLHKALRNCDSGGVSDQISHYSSRSIIKDSYQGDIPLLRKILEHQLQQQNNSSLNVCDNQRRSHENLENPRSPNRVFNRSPLMRIRSLTNSPLFRRLSLPGINESQCQPLFSSETKYFDNHVPSSTDNESNGSIISKGSLMSNDLSSQNYENCAKSKLLHLFDTTTESGRRKSLSDFAEQLCVIYEYQLGMLRGLKAVHAVADYIAELVLKALRTGIISGIDYNELTPAILFETQTRPSSASKYIKTCPLNVTGEQLTWRLGDIWTHAGLRHNEVGGENCHNLSIVTHFLAPFTPFGETRRPDIYGYRNLIVLPAGRILDKLNKSKPETDNYKNNNGNVCSLDVNETNEKSKNIIYIQGITKPQMYFNILHYDASTISRSRIRAGTKEDSLNFVATDSESKDNSIPSETFDPPERTRQTDTHSSSKNVQNSLNNTNSLRQHLHRAYRPVFFVIFDRPSVLEHLTECDSFSAFCKRQMISPVMFVNQSTDIFNGKTHPSLYHNFDLFRVTVSGYLCNSDSKKSFGNNTYTTELKLISSNETDLYTNKNARDKRLAAFDNPGFVC